MKKLIDQNLDFGKIPGMIRNFRKFRYRLKRVIDFIPIIWKGVDYDYESAITLFIFQLQRISKSIKNSKRITDWKYVTDRIDLAVTLLDKGYNAGYEEEVTAKFEAEYGVSRFITNEEEGDFFEITMWWENAEDSAENDIINEQYYKEHYNAIQKQEKAMQLAWKIIAKDIQTWWD